MSCTQPSQRLLNRESFVFMFLSLELGFGSFLDVGWHYLEWEDSLRVCFFFGRRKGSLAGFELALFSWRAEFGDGLGLCI